MADSSRNGDPCGLKAMLAALLTALMLVPTGHALAQEQPPAKAWSAGSENSGNLYSINFEGGRVTALRQLWLNAFTNDNFLIATSAERVELPAFQMRDMSLTELARSIAFLSQGALTVEVVRGNVGGPGNIWRVARPSQEALSQKLKMRAVAAPNLFANEATVSRFLEQAEGVQRQLAEGFIDLEKAGSPVQWMGTRILPLRTQRVFVLMGTDEGISGLESLIKAAEQTAGQPVREANSGK